MHPKNNGRGDPNVISIAIPLYNHASFIEMCLDSIAQQTGVEMELLLIDDGSSDNGFAIATAWLGTHAHLFSRTDFRQQKNAGITTTMDRLIKASTGRYFHLVASDDALLPNSLAERVSAFSEDRIMAVFGDAIPIDDNGERIGDSAIRELGAKASGSALSDPRTLLWELIFRWNVYGSVLMCRREALMRPDGQSILDVGLYSEDMQLYYKFAAAGALRYVDKPVALYRVHANNASRPANAITLRRNIQQSKQRALPLMPPLRKVVVAAQALTFNRWDRGPRSVVTVPIAIACTVALRLAKKFYDFYRRAFLKHASGL